MLFWEFDITGIFDMLRDFFSELRYAWGRMYITIGDYDFDLWSFVIVSLIFNILIMGYFFDDGGE